MDIIGERTKLFLSFIFQDNWSIAGKIIKLKLIYYPIQDLNHELNRLINIDPN